MDKKSNDKVLKKRVAIVDTGSNTIRLAIFDVSCGKKLCFKELLDKKNVAGLSAYTKGGIFSDEGIDKAATALKDHIKRAENLKCDSIFIFGTAVLRNCENSESAVSAIEDRIGRKIEILSEMQEASLGIKGALCKTDIEAGTMIDLGGGSCEVSVFEGDRCESKSLQFGCVSSYTKYVEEVIPTPAEYKTMKGEIAETIDGELKELNAGERELYGIGGSVRAISKMIATLKGTAKTEKSFNLSDIVSLEKMLEGDRAKFTHTLVSANADRVHSFVPGMIIVGSIMKCLQKDKLSICKGGLREGYFLSKLDDLI